MSELKIEIDGGQTEFPPGATLSGTLRWNLTEMPKSVDIRLLWYTQGKGDEDIAVVNSVTFDQPAQYETRRFSFQLPNGPYSFSGTLISLIWALEAVAQPHDQCQRLEITLSPTGKEINIARHSADD